MDNNNVIQKDLDEIQNIINQNRLLMRYKKNDNYRNSYDIFEKINDSEYGGVYKVKQKISEEIKAIKIIDKKSIIYHYINIYPMKLVKENMDEYITLYINKIKNMMIIGTDKNNNGNSIKLYEYYDTEDELVIVMELCDDILEDFLWKIIIF